MQIIQLQDQLQDWERASIEYHKALKTKYPTGPLYEHSDDPSYVSMKECDAQAEVIKKTLQELKIEISWPLYANRGIGSDSYAYEVIEWVDSNHMKIREMDWHNLDTWPDQRYEYSSKPNAPIIPIRRLKTGWKDENGRKYSLSREPYAYRDPSF